MIPIGGYERLYDIQFITIKHMLLQWHRLHTKSVTFMPKDINLLQHIGEDTIHT